MFAIDVLNYIMVISIVNIKSNISMHCIQISVHSICRTTGTVLSEHKEKPQTYVCGFEFLIITCL